MRMVQFWKKIKIDSNNGDIFYENKKILSLGQSIKESHSFSTGWWVLMVDRQLMPMEALQNQWNEEEVLLSGLIFDISKGQDFFCDLLFQYNQLSQISFGLTQSDDLEEKELLNQLFMVKQWLESQEVSFSLEMTNEEWVDYLMHHQAILNQCYTWGTLSVNYDIETGVIKIKLNGDGYNEGGNTIER